ncbi:DEAD/DEAH box helicase family protein [Paenibacillus sp. MZ04-78.2]|uniref:DEAD/DEAH box helicase family protein n=1 Tax=Paenibacillus sp. MZ04-78.2 TaxID=2962034 RepID=UPI0020B6F142|nr:DEAD/DEAH box helicase family protein [Paenibacillus sp. MZ04-78.2]MCP3776548.1 DEAD/DEAH box helicase family protein [Paenibacillus sp. MZ04-78.2]
MCTNFDFLKEKATFQSFAASAIEAEKSLLVSPATCAILARRALELAIKWVYTFDNELTIPYQDNISSLIHEPTFRQIIDPQLFPLMKYIIKLGNTSVHTNASITRDEAVLSIRNLHEVVRWIDYCYAEEYTCPDFNEEILHTGEEKRTRPQELQDLYEKLSSKDQRLEELRKENEALREAMTAQRITSTENYDFEVDAFSEAETRSKYIDLELKLAGWEMGRDCITEVPVEGMPNATGTGFVDYVLYGSNGRPLAIIEAKKTGKDPIVGSQQAKLYADCLHNQTGQRPVIFTTNGFEINLLDDAEGYPQRRVSGLFTKDELQLMVDRRCSKVLFTSVEIDEKITNRYYQKQAVMDVCHAITNKQRKMLLVMATGSGKTRTAISIVDVLMRHNVVKNILFLADRRTLVKQAKRNFSNLLPSLTLCNLLENKDNPEQSRMIFSTYPTMMNAIDDSKRQDGKKLFTPGHFDLIIVDESHRSIYKKYRDIFEYYDAMLLGLTATPKDEIDKNTYSIFELENGVPTFAYELEKAVEDEYLVDYRVLEKKTKIMEDGIYYDELSEEEKEEFEKTFDDDETVDDSIANTAINEWLFNANTIDLVLDELMEKGLRVEGGDQLGKTIIFAKSSRHAQAIVERFHKRYPEHGNHFMKQIDYSINYVDSIIDDFSTKEKFPQIAVSVDMLDTGVDIPEVLNLVFFKKVRSKSKFWQMIGRGTRLCKDLLGIGMDKERFLIFDFCNNFEFFRANPKGLEGEIGASLTEKLFSAKLDIVREFQHLKYQEESDYIRYREDLLRDLLGSVRDLNEESFRVKLKQRYVEIYKNKDSWQSLNAASVSELKEHIAPLITPLQDDELAKRFDLLIYTIDLAYLQQKNATKPIRSIVRTAEALSKLGTIPQVLEKKYIIEKVQTDEFWQQADVLELEEVRVALRELIKFIEKSKQKIYYTDFKDQIIETRESGAIYNTNNLKDYKKKVEHYLKEHKDELAIYKLRNNKQLTTVDLQTLERILWEELGSRSEYEKEFGDTAVSKLVRRMVGLDRAAANEAFSAFLSEEKLNSTQIRFVKLIVDYIVANGMIEDNRIFMEEPFRSLGSITTLFKDNMDDAKEIMNVVSAIKRNCEIVV